MSSRIWADIGRVLLLVALVMPAAARADYRLPPTDDSLWQARDSIVIGPPLDSFWRGLCLDPNGYDFWITKGDSWTDIRKRHLVTGSSALQADGHCPRPGGLVRFTDTLCIASVGSNHFDLYDTLGVWHRTIPSPLPGLRGVDWDGDKFWATSADSQRVFTVSRTGALLRVLNWRGTPPAGIDMLSLDRTLPDRFWLSSRASIRNIHYCSFDTLAGTCALLATFDRPCVRSPGGLAFDPGGPEGASMYVTDSRGPWLWRVKVHEPLTGVADALAPASGLRLRTTTGSFLTDATGIVYTLPHPGPIRLRLFRVTGELAATLVQGSRPAGTHTVSLPASCHSLAAGAYLIRLEAEPDQTTSRLVCR